MTAAASTRDPGQLGPVPDAPGPPTRKACHPQPPRGPGCRGRYDSAARAARAARAALADRAVVLRAGGMMVCRIAAELGVAKSTICFWTHPAQVRARANADPEAEAKSAAISARVKALRSTGASYSRIAAEMTAELGRPVKEGTVQSWIRRGARPGLLGKATAIGDPTPPSPEEIRRWCDVLRPTSAERDRRKARDGDREWARYSPTFGRLCAILDRED